MSSAIIFFSFLLLTSLTNVLGISVNGMSINRIFNNLPIGLITSAVSPLDSTGNVAPHFDRAALEKNVKNYLSKSLDPYIESYKISFRYFKVSDGEYVIDSSSLPQNVDIHFKCTYCAYINFDGYRSFRIERK